MHLINTMEGASARIESTQDPNVVVKRMKRGVKGSLPIAKQYEIQTWSSEILCPENGFHILQTPRAWSPEEKQYKMQRIDDSKMVSYDQIGSIEGLEAEIKQYVQAAKLRGLYPNDFELYEQSSGKVVLLDFDKFGVWEGQTVLFPWGQKVSGGQLPFEN